MNPLALSPTPYGPDTHPPPTPLQVMAILTMWSVGIHKKKVEACELLPLLAGVKAFPTTRGAWVSLQVSCSDMHAYMHTYPPHTQTHTQF